jgi:zinc transport system ATP-binding protein
VSPVVALRGASVAYDGHPAVEDVDLVVDRGEVVAVLGANGSGKSTVVRAVVGLLPLVTGSLELFGTPRAHFREWTRLGYVPQRAGATTGVPATVREVVATGRLARSGLRRSGPADRRAVEAAIEAVGLADRARASVGTLSGGQQQRVLIARALAGEPELLVLDEPTAGVDLPNQQALADALEVLQRRGATIVLVAHELGPLEPLIDRAVVMRDGRIAYDGPLRSQDDAAHGHHHPDGRRHDHVPHVGSPFDSLGGHP